MNRGPTLLFIGLALLILSACVAGITYHPTKVKDASDLSEVSGRLHSYSFRENRNQHHYAIWFSEYPATFQVPGDDRLFSRARFESDLHKGDVLWVSIPKVSEKDLASDKRILVFSVRTKTATYLDEKDAIQSFNSHLGIWMSVVFLLGGVGFLIWDLKVRLTPRLGPPSPQLPFLE